MYLHEASHGGPHRHKLAILSEQQNHRCCYCGVRFSDQLNLSTSASIEHVIRLCDGGARAWNNEVAACRRCNSSRGAVDAMLFYEMRETLIGEPPLRPYRQKRRKKSGRSNRLRVRVWQTQTALVRHDTHLGSFREVWPKIEARTD